MFFYGRIFGILRVAGILFLFACMVFSIRSVSVSAQILTRDFTFSLPLFASNSAWNQTATNASVLALSDQQILVTYRVLRGDTTSLYPPGAPVPTTWPFMDVGVDVFTIPIFRAGAGEQSVLICDYDGRLAWPGPKFPDNQQPGGPVTVPAPAGMARPSGPQNTGADGWLVLYNPDTFTSYDYWQATTARSGQCQSLGGGQTGATIFEAGAIDFFDIRGSGSNIDTYSSARAVGTPLLAGVILPEDVESGAISHALSFAIPGPRNTSSDTSMPLTSDYFYPASTTETDFYTTDPFALAAGQRIRLKQTIVDDGGNIIDENQLAPITRMYLTALRTFGAYLVDNAAGFSFYAEDSQSASLNISDEQVNTLIGQSVGAPLPTGRTRWQIVIDKINEELETIPIAYGPWTQGQDPATATITTSNFEVVDPATGPVDISADIKANSSDGPVTITTNDTLSIAVSLGAGSNAGQNADWWLVDNTPAGTWNYYDLSGAWLSGLIVTHQGALSDLNSYQINVSGLSTGLHTFYFGVDTIMNGSVDLNQIYYDPVVVNVAE